MTGPDAVETLREPAALLRRARRWLVMAGLWTALTAGLISAAPLGASAAAAAGGFDVLHEFASEGGNPAGKLLQTADGKIYGTSSTGGVAGMGSVFVLTPTGGGGFTFSTLHSFDGSDGEFLQRGLVLGQDGDFYGVTYEGGANSVGTVFKMTPSGTLTTLHTFVASEGSTPVALVLGNDGDFYGLTQRGSTFDQGSFFKITPAGVLTTLHAFDISDSTLPSELIQASDGNFYGTTGAFGLPANGMVFQITPSGSLTIVHGFSGSDGASPRGLIQAVDGNFYGTTVSGGGTDDGTIFQLTPTGTLTTLHSFSGSDGSFPLSLIQAAGGDFYGTTSGGGSLGDGTVFRITLAGSLTTLYTFSGTDGRIPTAIIQAADGDFYGTTLFDGPSLHYGTVFRLTAAGALTNLYTFLNPEGEAPAARLIEATDGNFYGTTFGNGGLGSVFRIDPSGALTPLHLFSGAEGSQPFGGLIEGADGDFYGTTELGGDNGLGTVFRITSGGDYTTLHSFADTDGAIPHAAVIQAEDGDFYGTTIDGGSNGYGTVFRMTSAGVLTTLHPFANDTDGARPWAGLIQATDGDFYGTTLSGGAWGAGTVFRITPSGALTTLFSFDLGADGGNPSASLIQAADGNFYGTTAEGGAGGVGTVFRITPSGTLTTLHAFSGADGANSLAELIQGADGNFYGTTETGGENDNGTVFRITPSGAVTTLHSFAGTDGNAPFAGLLEATDGNFYGSTINGGSGRGGVIYRLSGACLPPLAGNNGPICEGETLQLTASDVAGATYSWTGPGGFTSAAQNPQIPSAPPSASGLYSVTITADGCVSVPATTSAVVRPLSAAISAPASICPGSSGSASTPSAGPGAIYGWSITNGTITSGAGTRTITFTAGGSGLVELDVTVTDAIGCGASGSKSVAIALPEECGSRNLIPDGRAVQTTLVSAGSLYRGSVVAGRSYCIEVETPFDGAGTLGSGGPLPALAVTRSDGVTAVVASATTSCEPAAAARLSFTPTADDVSGGPLQFSVSDASAGGYAIRVRLTETTMFCPRWSVNGYTALISLQDTTDCPVTGKVLLLDSSGVPVTALPFSLLPGGAVQMAVPAGLPAVFGSAILTHDGPPEAITGGIYMVQPGVATGANFRWPFQETRSGASSDGR